MSVTFAVFQLAALEIVARLEHPENIRVISVTDVRLGASAAVMLCKKIQFLNIEFMLVQLVVPHWVTLESR